MRNYVCLAQWETVIADGDSGAEPHRSLNSFSALTLLAEVWSLGGILKSS